MNHLLEIKQLVISYGAIEAVKGVNIVVKPGTIVALLGANGAGKSTILRTVSGVIKPKSGEILYKNHPIHTLSADKIARSGIIASPEGRLIMKDLTVEENLRVGAFSLRKKEVVEIIDGVERKRVKSVPEQRQENFARVYRYFPVLAERKKQMASTLSGGELQMLAIGRALMASPNLMVLDEPSLGLAPLIVRDIFRIIQEIKNEGITILIVEQNAYQALKIADYAYVINLGKVKLEGTGSDLSADQSLIAAYLGEQK